MSGMSSAIGQGSGRVRSGWEAWLVLGRVSNLPTVWSNCLAAWLLGGGGPLGRFLLLSVGASLLYLGGMLLNDACDVAFDREFRPERPIPAGRVALADVWVIGLGLLGLGELLLASMGSTTAWLGALLVLAIAVYDLTHKRVPFAPGVMALCRFLLFLAAASAAEEGIDGTVMWSAWVLGFYVLGLSFVAQRESTGGPVRPWALIGLAAPLVLAFFVNPSYVWTSSRFMPAVLLVIWAGRCVAHLYRDGQAGIPRAVSGLLAGIVLVDLLAVLPAPWPWGAGFLALFGAALLFQRFAPAT